MNNSICVVLLGSLLCAIVPAHAQKRPVPPASETTVEPELYEFKAKTLEGQVKEAVDQYGKEGMSPIIQLMGEYEKSPDKVLVLLRPYWNSTDYDVQEALIEAAALAPESQESMAILIHLLHSDADSSATTLYREYTADQLIKRGGRRLKVALLHGAISNRYTTDGYLLLSCFKNDKSILDFLKRRRATFKTFYPAPKSPDDYPSDKTREITALDLALTELGDEDAGHRIEALFARNQPRELQALLQFLKFVNNKTVLTQAVEQLKNQSVLQPVTDVQGKLLRNWRVCDQAIIDLPQRFDPSQPSLFRDYYPFPDAQVQTAYAKYQAALAAMP